MKCLPSGIEPRLVMKLVVSDPENIAFRVADRAQSQVDAQLQAFEALDVKALGVLAANVAMIGVLAAVHGSLSLWWLPVILLSIGAGFLLAVVWPTDTYAGPAWGEWYVRFGGLPPAEVGRQMLADLLATIRHNEAARTKNGRYFRFGFLATFSGLCVIVVVAVVG